MDMTKVFDIQRINPEPGDYYADNGALMCGRCNVRKEIEDKRNGTFLPVMCDCEMIAKQKAEALEKRKARYAKLPKEHRHHFSESDGRSGKAEAIAKRYVERFDNAKNIDMCGLLFYGDVRKGKTFLAGCIATELAERGERVNIASMAELVAQAQEHGFDRDSWVKRILSCDLLVIDDLGVERSTPTAFEIVFHIIDGRSKQKRPLIVTTNLDLKQLTNPAQIENTRIYARILEMCFPVKVESSKGMVKRESYDEAKALYLS